jgi:Protein of unknown function (DUF2530)
VPSTLSTLWHPRRSAPPPVAIDLRRVMLLGTAVWAMALAVTLVLALLDALVWDPVWVCATGTVLGVVGADWARRNPAVPAHEQEPTD